MPHQLKIPILRGRRTEFGTQRSPRRLSTALEEFEEYFNDSLQPARTSTREVQPQRTSPAVRIGRRTGKDVLAGKVIQRQSNGLENFLDYFTDESSEEDNKQICTEHDIRGALCESLRSRNSTSHAKQEVGERVVSPPGERILSGDEEAEAERASVQGLPSRVFFPSTVQVTPTGPTDVENYFTSMEPEKKTRSLGVDGSSILPPTTEQSLSPVPKVDQTQMVTNAEETSRQSQISSQLTQQNATYRRRRKKFGAVYKRYSSGNRPPSSILHHITPSNEKHLMNSTKANFLSSTHLAGSTPAISTLKEFLHRDSMLNHSSPTNQQQKDITVAEIVSQPTLSLTKQTSSNVCSLQEEILSASSLQLVRSDPKLNPQKTTVVLQPISSILLHPKSKKVSCTLTVTPVPQESSGDKGLETAVKRSKQYNAASSPEERVASVNLADVSMVSPGSPRQSAPFSPPYSCVATLQNDEIRENRKETTAASKSPTTRAQRRKDMRSRLSPVPHKAPKVGNNKQSRGESHKRLDSLTEKSMSKRTSSNTKSKGKTKKRDRRETSDRDPQQHSVKTRTLPMVSPQESSRTRYALKQLRGKSRQLENSVDNKNKSPATPEIGKKTPSPKGRVESVSVNGVSKASQQHDIHALSTDEESLPELLHSRLPPTLPEETKEGRIVSRVQGLQQTPRKKTKKGETPARSPVGPLQMSHTPLKQQRQAETVKGITKNGTKKTTALKPSQRVTTGKNRAALPEIGLSEESPIATRMKLRERRPKPPNDGNYRPVYEYTKEGPVFKGYERWSSYVVPSAWDYNCVAKSGKRSRKPHKRNISTALEFEASPDNASPLKNPENRRQKLKSSHDVCLALPKGSDLLDFEEMAQVRELIVRRACDINFLKAGEHDDPDNGYEIATQYLLQSCHTGLIRILPGRSKKQVDLHHSNIIFIALDNPVHLQTICNSWAVLSKGDACLVPKGSSYTIKNLSQEQEAVLHFIVVP